MPTRCRRPPPHRKTPQPPLNAKDRAREHALVELEGHNPVDSSPLGYFLSAALPFFVSLRIPARDNPVEKGAGQPCLRSKFATYLGNIRFDISHSHVQRSIILYVKGTLCRIGSARVAEHSNVRFRGTSVNDFGRNLRVLVESNGAQAHGARVLNPSSSRDTSRTSIPAQQQGCSLASNWAAKPIRSRTRKAS